MGLALAALTSMPFFAGLDAAALDRVAQRTAPGLRSNFEQVLLPRLTDRERQKLGGISLDLSRREYAEHPLNFYAATGGKVVLPLSSVKLASDLSLALAGFGLQARFARWLAALAGAATDRKSTRLNSSHIPLSRMPSSA